MATKKTIETPQMEQVSKAEDVLEVNVSIENEVEEPTSVEEAEPQTVEVEKSIEQSAMDKEQILALLAEKVEEEPSAALRTEVEALKVAFYKIHRAEVDARRKAFFAEHGEDAEYKPQEVDDSEMQFKQLYNNYRTKRDLAAAISEKAKEENYHAKLSIIEELKALIATEQVRTL